MKAISIRQPWAWCIVNGYKDIENRTWSTKHRGRILIHAAKTIDLEHVYFLREIFEDEGIDFPDKFLTGGIVGTAVLKDCVTSHKSEWFSGPYGFVLSKAKPLPFRPYRGQLGIYEVTK